MVVEVSQYDKHINTGDKVSPLKSRRPLTDNRKTPKNPTSSPGDRNDRLTVKKAASLLHTRTTASSSNMQMPQQPPPNVPTPDHPQNSGSTGSNDQGFSTILLIFIPIMVVVLTVLLGMVVFLVTVLYLRRKKGIKLTEDGGPLDLGKGNGDGVIGEGGVEGVEQRWLDGVDPDVREAYRKAKGGCHTRVVYRRFVSTIRIRFDHSKAVLIYPCSER
jgi:hypothetical protein